MGLYQALVQVADRYIGFRDRFAREAKGTRDLDRRTGARPRVSQVREGQQRVRDLKIVVTFLRLELAKI